MSRLIYAWLLLIGLLTTSCGLYVHTVENEGAFDTVNEDVPPDSLVDAMIEPYRQEISAEMGEVIGYMPETLEKKRPNSSLGNWFADILLTHANEISDQDVDFAVQNYGGLRLNNIPKGPVTKGKIYELMPFDNMLVILEMNADTLQMLLDQIASHGGWPVSRNVSFRISDNSATDITVHGQAISSSQTYRVALPDYIANGGDGSDFLTGLPSENTGIFIRNIIIDYLLELQEKDQAITIDHSQRIKS